jgi:Uma2 family endonuclease
MAEVADKLWTLKEFLAFDDGTDTSYQLFEGRLVAMNPPLVGHAALVGRLIRIIGNQLKRPCEVYAEAGVIPVNRRHSWYKADLIVSCTPGNYQDPFVAEPVLVVEVLSPSTSATAISRTISRSRRCGTFCWSRAWNAWSGTGGVSRIAGSSAGIGARPRSA